MFLWACFLSEGAYKKVYKVWNAVVAKEEVVSVMDVDYINSMGNKTVVGAELEVSALLSSLARRNICPNFVITMGVFTYRFEPPVSHWGKSENKPLGSKYNPRIGSPSNPTLTKQEISSTFEWSFVSMEIWRISLHVNLKNVLMRMKHGISSFKWHLLCMWLVANTE